MAQAKLFQKQRIQKTIFILSLLGAFSSSLFADGIPSWYSDEIQVTEMEISRKNPEGVYADYIDTTYSACSFVRAAGNNMSLEEARDEAEKAASQKLIFYLESNNKKEALKMEPKLFHSKYDDSLSNGGAYVAVKVVVSKEKPKEAQKNNNAIDEIKQIEESSELGRVIVYKYSEKFTLVDKIDFSSQESMESHKVSVSEKSNVDKNSCTHSRAIAGLYYPDGRFIQDTLYTLKNSNLNFKLKNIIRGRKTLIIIRTDVKTQNDDLVLSYWNSKFKAKITPDTENRWRNLVLEVEQGVIAEYNPEFSLEVSKALLSVGTIYIYQLL